MNVVSNSFLKKSRGQRLVGVCTDVAPIMPCSKSGFMILVKKKNSDVMSHDNTLPDLYREALASTTLPTALKVIDITGEALNTSCLTSCAKT